MFRKILVANRGEIALRVIRTCKRLGIRTVAVYSDVDLDSLHVTAANEAFRIGSGPPLDSYLNIQSIIRVAKESKAEGIHPGYGFLAENADFARTCEENDLVFIGPSSRALGTVANKLASKKYAAAAGVPVVPGIQTELESEDRVESDARRIGYPILVKAVFGGGGRGMRIVRNEKQLHTAIESARSEATTGFGHPELYMEKYLDRPRHIEVQIIAGPRGKFVHLGERECSVQRRYQKILEETPSPALNIRQRRQVIELALKVVKATKYENAGTVEFMLSQRNKFYYLETNKRIQVEHLISEMVTNIDIVEKQLMIASEHSLDLSQNEIAFTGAALNCRINAEDPSHTFAPNPGIVEEFVPPGGPGVRIDSALYNGSAIPEFYDSLIAKIATLGVDRQSAIERMRVALAETVIEGVATTIPVHQTILSERSFARGVYDTQFLDALLRNWTAPRDISRDEAAAVFFAIREARSRKSTPVELPSANQSQWRARLAETPEARPALYVEGI